MHSHKLTSADAWFIEKGQIDSISRSRFNIGDDVVVCDKQHVMLADFYEGECHACHSKGTVPFNRENVEPGTLRSYIGECPECQREAAILFRQHGIISPFIGKCPKCNKTVRVTASFLVTQVILQRFKKQISAINTALGWTLGLLVVCVLVLIFTGKISNDKLLEYAQTSILPRSQSFLLGVKDFWVSERVNDTVLSANKMLIARSGILFANMIVLLLGVKDFWVSERVNDTVLSANKMLIARSEILFANMIALLVVLANGLKVIVVGLWGQLLRSFNRTVDLANLFKRRTKTLIELIIRWVNGIVNLFA